MPRKPRVRSRRASDQSGDPSPTGPPRRARRDTRTPKTFWQCQACGAPVDPMYGRGDDSWCPSCHTSGQVYGMEGQLPSPQLYGAWVVQQQRKAEAKRAEAELTEFLKRHQTQKEDPTMKRKTTHSGSFYCPKCFIQFELVAEESLKCPDCGGPLAEGTLDDVWADDEEGRDDDE